MAELGPLYHWSPRDRRNAIEKVGLVPGMVNFHGPTYHDPEHPEGGEYRQPSVSASLDPVTAWTYSHGAWKSTGTFDLWCFELKSGDAVHVQPFWGGRIVELRVANKILKSRLIWVGERTVE